MRNEDQQSVVARLAAKYPIFAVTTIQRWVANEAGKYSAAKIQQFIPVLVQRAVDATLRELARPEGTASDALALDTPDRLSIVTVRSDDRVAN
jgi:hypothetical protein